jgi:NAD(P)-dependent dehydrogenase (short-subunit alcohol dehydrogenase family)
MTSIPAQTQPAPGVTEAMQPAPRDQMRDYTGSGRLAGKRALVTGGDSGIGRAVAIGFAKEGADVAISFLAEIEEGDAAATRTQIEAAGRKAVSIRTDLSNRESCIAAVDVAARQLGGIDILVNNIAFQRYHESLEDIDEQELMTTFATNVYSYIWCTQAALPFMPRGGVILNTGSINGLRGNRNLVAYAATKGAVHALTYSLAQSLQERGIRVNCVAPGPVWTPLIPSTMPPDHVEGFGRQTPFGRAAEPDEIAPSYIFFACDELSRYYSGEVLAPIGGETLPG